MEKPTGENRLSEASMAPSDAPRSLAEAGWRRAAEQQERILADRFSELGLHEGGGVGKAAQLPVEAATDEIAVALWIRLQEIRRQIADLRRNPPPVEREMLEP